MNVAIFVLLSLGKFEPISLDDLTNQAFVLLLLLVHMNYTADQ